MGVEARRIATRWDGMQVEAEGGGVRQEQRRQRGEPCRQQAMWMFPWCAVGGVGGTGRLGEHSESRKEPERLIDMEVADRAATFLVQQLQGEQAEQGAGSG